MSDIGHKITHTFQITNDGPWHVENMDVLVDWPYQLATSEMESHGDSSENIRRNIGKWLLYLTEPPEITPRGAGQCFINSRNINALGLREGAMAGRVIHSRSSNSRIPFLGYNPDYSISRSHSRTRTETTKYHYRSSGTFSSFGGSASSLYSTDKNHEKHQRLKKKRKRRKRSLQSAHLATHTANDISYKNYEDSSRGRSDISSSEYSEDSIYSDSSVGWTATSSQSNSPYLSLIHI